MVWNLSETGSRNSGNLGILPSHTAFLHMDVLKGCAFLAHLRLILVTLYGTRSGWSKELLLYRLCSSFAGNPW